MKTITNKYPIDDGFYMPAEYEMHAGTWMLWPERNDIWRLGAKPAQEVFAEIANTIVNYENVSVGVSQSQYENARNRLNHKIRVVEISYDDAWIRDTGPTYLINKRSEIRGVDWHFNAWGGIGVKNESSWELSGSYYPWKLDDMVARKVLEIDNIYRYRCPLTLEGGAIHVDGNGTLIATKECVLGRNANLTVRQIENILSNYLGVTNIIWLERGLYVEENNGHIDNMCCFADAETILLNWCNDKSDPQYDISKEAYNILIKAKNTVGNNYNVVKLAQPPVQQITEKDHVGVDLSEYAIPRMPGDRLPATYINSYICNGAVLIPSFGANGDKELMECDANAYKIYSVLFKQKLIVQIPSRELLLGGGGIHCVLQQIPYNNK
ncbi:MAG: agmatine deiminase [Chlorobiales bacterium]|nr:agmatine deiminase [Chlorobiales bacterium]